jgi:hypothetical protein
MKYQSMDWGRMESVVNKLGGLEGVDQFLKGEIVIRTKDGKPIWPVWKKITVGNFNDTKEISVALGKKEVDFESSELILNEIPISTEIKTLDLALVSLKDIGVTNLDKWNSVFDQAEKLGLLACPPEIGPQLRLQYEQQPGEIDLIGMHGLVAPDGTYHIFSLWRSELGMHMDTIDPLNEVGLYEDANFVFVIDK